MPVIGWCLVLHSSRLYSWGWWRRKKTTPRHVSTLITDLWFSLLPPAHLSSQCHRKMIVQIWVMCLPLHVWGRQAHSVYSQCHWFHMGQGKAVSQLETSRGLFPCLDLVGAIGVIVAITGVAAIFILARGNIQSHTMHLRLEASSWLDYWHLTCLLFSLFWWEFYEPWAQCSFAISFGDLIRRMTNQCGKQTHWNIWTDPVLSMI